MMRFSKPVMNRLLAGCLLLVAVPMAGCAEIEDLGRSLDDVATTDGETEQPDPLTATGFLEAEEVSVVSEVRGRVSEVLADEADNVAAGQIIVVLDDALLRADRAEAQAAVAVSEASLAELIADPTDDEVEAAQATVDQAEAALAGAQREAGQAWTTANNPLSMDVQIAQAQLEVDNTHTALVNAQKDLEKVEYELSLLYQDDEEDRDDGRIIMREFDRERLIAQVAAAQAEFDGAVRRLDALKAQRENPVAEITTARRASAQIPVAEARLEVTRANYNLVVAEARPEEVAIAEARIAFAEAQVALIDARIGQLTLISPISGVVTSRAIASGETASPGVALLTIANLDVLKLTVYIPETQIGRVRIGSTVDVMPDAYEDEIFVGEVVSIGREAEFTPRNVQTEEERVNLVFAVEIRIENDDGRLKPGMPVDVTFDTDD